MAAVTHPSTGPAARDHPDPRRRHPRRRRDAGGAEPRLPAAPLLGGGALPRRPLDLRRAGQGRPRPRGVSAADLLERVHHHLRLLGGHRPRGHADLGHPLSLPLALANGGVPIHRGDDGVRGHDRGPLSDHPHRPAVDLLLAAAVSQPAVPLAQLQVAAHLGRLRHRHIPDGEHDVPRLRPHSRRRGGARQGDRVAEEGVRDGVGGLAGHRQPVAALQQGLPLSGRPRHAAGALGTLGRVVGLRRRPSCRDGTGRSSPRTSWPAPSTPASAWCSR